jgi:hypothetical protein
MAQAEAAAFRSETGQALPACGRGGRRAGERVAPGKGLGRLGTTDNREAHRLPFALADHPSAVRANRVPVGLDRSTRAGGVEPDAVPAAVAAPAAPAPVAGMGMPQRQPATPPLGLPGAAFP